MTDDWLEMMRAHIKGASGDDYLDAWIALAVHLAESHPEEAAAWISRQGTSVHS